jgi:dihydrofolate reductase
MHATVYIATSLDGFIARKDGSIDWLTSIENPSNDDFGYQDFISGIDAIVIGRATFETVLAFPGWPYTKPVFVLSSTLRQVPEKLKGKVSLLNLEPAQALEHLTREGHTRVYIDGGKTVQGFLREGLIDRLIVTKIPVLLGEGIPLFGPLAQDQHWVHVKTDVYPNGLVKSEYRRGG